MIELTPEEIDRRAAELDAQWHGRGVTCQCPACRCTQPAEARLEIHQIGSCDGADANQLGNRVELLCLDCARTAWLNARTVIERVAAVGARMGAVPLCGTCGAPLTNPSDIIRFVLREEGGIR